jgi:hypothetical protein
MTARARLVALRRVLSAVVLLRAAFVGASVAIVAAVAAHALSLALPTVVLAATIGVFAAAVIGREALAARSLDRVALWVEERHPALRYALVTVAEGATSAEVESQAMTSAWWEAERRHLLSRLIAPTLMLLAALALLAWRPLLVRPSASAGSSALPAGNTGESHDADPLASLRLTVDPPGYTGRSSYSVDDPSSVAALVASRIVISGAGDPALVTVTADSALRPVVRRDDGWSTTFVMPARPALVRLRSTVSGGRERLVVLAPITDAPPTVTLMLPASDTVVRAAVGGLVLRAQLRDDIGLRDADFEIIISSGQEENFTFRTTLVGRAVLGGRTESVLETRLSLDSLSLEPGDLLQLRAVARDANDATGPGVGSSETRALRVMRTGEGDSVAVEGAAPGDREGEAFSQRMLITLTEALQHRRASLDRRTLVSESHRIAVDQARLRKQVGDIVFQRTGAEPLSEEGSADLPDGKLTPEALLARARAATGAEAGTPMDVEGDETPILAINKPLLEAFNSMWDAGRSLEQGDPAGALPPMRRALAAIERARQAERIYLRGRPAAVVVDVARARLTGKERGITAIRDPRLVADPAARRRAETFARASALLATDAGAAADSLLVLRVGALGDAPALAALLDSAARVTRQGSAAEIPLAWARVRRALGGAPRRSDSLPAWGGAP